MPKFANRSFSRYFSGALRLDKDSAALHEYIAFALLIVMAFQPLQGLTAHAETNNAVIELFEKRVDLVRLLGYISFANAAAYHLRRGFTHGLRPLLRESFVERPWNLCLLLLLVWSFICTGHAPLRHVALSGHPVRFEGVLSYIAYAGLFMGAGIVRREKLQRYLLAAMGIAASLLAVIALWCFKNPSANILSYQNVGIIAGLTATFVNTNHYGYYLCTMVIALLSMAVIAKKPVYKLIFALLCGYQLVVLLLNNTMGCIVAAAAGVLTALLLLALQRGGRTMRIALSLLAAVLLLICAVAAIAATHPDQSLFLRDISLMMQEFGSILSGEADDAAGSGRIGIWRACMELIRDHPLMGAGTDQAYYALEEYYGIQKMPHNEYLNMGVNLGLPGLGLYLGALCSMMILRLRRLRSMPLITLLCGCSAFTYAVSAFFGVPIFSAVPFFYIFLGLFSQDALPDTKP